MSGEVRMMFCHVQPLSAHKGKWEKKLREKRAFKPQNYLTISPSTLHKICAMWKVKFNVRTLQADI